MPGQDCHQPAAQQKKGPARVVNKIGNTGNTLSAIVYIVHVCDPSFCVNLLLNSAAKFTQRLWYFHFIALFTSWFSCLFSSSFLSCDTGNPLANEGSVRLILTLSFSLSVLYSAERMEYLIIRTTASLSFGLADIRYGVVASE